MTSSKYIISVDMEEFNQIIKNTSLSAHLPDLIKSNQHKFSYINRQFEEMNKDTLAMIAELQKERKNDQKSSSIQQQNTVVNQKSFIDELDKIKQDIEKSNENNHVPLKTIKNKKSRE